MLKPCSFSFFPQSRYSTPLYTFLVSEHQSNDLRVRAVPVKTVAPLLLFFLSHFLFPRFCPSIIIQFSDCSCCVSCRKKHKLEEGSCEPPCPLKNSPGLRITKRPCPPPLQRKWLQPAYHFKALIILGNRIIWSIIKWQYSLEVTKLQATKVQEPKGSSLPFQQIRLDQSQKQDQENKKPFAN